MLPAPPLARHLAVSRPRIEADPVAVPRPWLPGDHRADVAPAGDRAVLPTPSRAALLAELRAIAAAPRCAAHCAIGCGTCAC